MNTKELEERLIAEGCNPRNFCISKGRHGGDVFVLEKNQEGSWIVYYTERGNRDAPSYESQSESEACAYYYKKIIAMEHRHIVCIYQDEKLAEDVERKLREAGLKPGRNDGGFMRKGDPTWKRVYVVGTEIFKARELYPDMPMKDW